MLIDDTLLRIFSYLSLKEWLLLEQVSHRWNNLVKQQWKTLRDVQLASLIGVKPYNFQDFPERCLLLSCPTVPAKMIAGLAERCGKNLRTLSSGCGFTALKLPLSCLETLALEFPKLVTLDLNKLILIWADGADEGDESIEEDRVQQFSIGALFFSLKTLNMEKCFDDSSIAYHSLDSVDAILFKVRLVTMTHEL